MTTANDDFPIQTVFGGVLSQPISFDVSDDDDHNDRPPRNIIHDKKKKRKKSVMIRRVAVIESDDEENKEEDAAEEDDDEEYNNDSNNQIKRRLKPPRPSTTAVRKSMAIADALKTKRKRRRSSAKFLRLHERNNKRDDTRGDIDDNASVMSNATTNTTVSANQNLTELYDKAIRMNAENRINAGNSWSLRLIENIDKFLEHVIEEDGDEDDDDEDADGNINSISNKDGSKDKSKVSTAPRRVNFTKASCTLDASVKIYSYRVDDVHLSSYKVLANLNRNDNNKDDENNSKKNKKNNDLDKTINDDNNFTSEYDDDGDDANDSEFQCTKGNTNKKNTSTKHPESTLETNINNINLNKLDSAFDIDPLFHKMSKSFDEGGAKGLLLHNLGVGANGCNIVFDSTLDTIDDNDTVIDTPPTVTTKTLDTIEENENDGDTPTKTTTENVFDSTLDKIDEDGAMTEKGYNEPQFLVKNTDEIDISWLSEMLTRSLDGQSLESTKLVPQLEIVREEYHLLESQGFVVENDTSPSTKKNADKRIIEQPDLEEEREVEKSIKKIALERNCRFSMTPAKHRLLGQYRMSMEDDNEDDGNNHMSPKENNDDGENVIFSSGFGDFDCNDDDDDVSYSGYVTSGRFSNFSQPDSDANIVKATAASNLLDAMTDGSLPLIGNGTSSQYFDLNVFKDSTNSWAGAGHWKRRGIINNNNKPKTIKEATTTKSSKKKVNVFSNDSDSFVSFDIPTPLLSHLLEKQNNTKSKSTGVGSRKKKNTSIQLGKATITKLTSNENLLPDDIGFNVEELSQLFSLPHYYTRNNNNNLTTTTAANDEDSKFLTINNNVWGDDDNSIGGDNDGPGFTFVNNDDNMGDDNGVVFDDDVVDMSDIGGGTSHILNDIRKIEKIHIGYATVAKKVDVKRLKSDLWVSLEQKLLGKPNNTDDCDDPDDELDNNTNDSQIVNSNDNSIKDGCAISFKETIHELERQQVQQDVTVPFYFICILHLANEKCLKLSNNGSLLDFTVEEG